MANTTIIEPKTSKPFKGLSITIGMWPSNPLWTKAIAVLWLCSKAFRIREPVRVPKELKPRLKLV
jgi:hypothetical protein